MKSMYKLRDMLCDELDAIAEKGEISMGDLDVAHKAVATIKNIDKIATMGGYSHDDEYSRGGRWEADMRGTFGHGDSYRRSRDSMGRYSRDDAQGHMRMQLEKMIHDTDDERIKEALHRCMGALVD